MPPVLRTALLVLALLAAAAAPALAQGGGQAPPPSESEPDPTTRGVAPPFNPGPTPRLRVLKPRARTLIREGQAGRYLMSGTWYFRRDDARRGMRRRIFRQRSLRGWQRVSVPHNWNGADTQYNQQSWGWYRTEFRIPRPPRRRNYQWKLRFEGVNHSATVWLNGRKLGQHAGGYLPFEVPARGLRRGRNRLVVLASTFRSRNDLTHWKAYGYGGWWNFGGMNREVYLRRVDTVDVEDAAVLPRQRSVGGPARVRLRVKLRNFSRRSRSVGLRLRLSGPRGAGRRTIRLTPRVVRGRRARVVATSFTIRRPRLWQPGRPRLYRLTVSARGDGRELGRYGLAFGVRKVVRRGDGRLLINGRVLQARGASIHEDDVTQGAAWSPGRRRAALAQLRNLGANMTRAHYPLHPSFMEALDRAGILYWSQAPVYQLKNSMLNNRRVQRNAVNANAEVVRNYINHPSIIVWSLANELGWDKREAGAIGPGYQRFVNQGARVVRKLDGTRLVGIDRHSRIGENFYSPALARLDAIGVNEYFGWYDASQLSRPSRLSDLGPYLDQVHAAYPRAAMFVTEFGAESTVSGSETLRGSFAYQTKFLRDHLRVHGSRPYLNGSLIWALQDFRVIAGWDGGNSTTRSTPPWNNKGLIDQNGTFKPAYGAVASEFKATPPLR